MKSRFALLCLVTLIAWAAPAAAVHPNRQHGGIDSPLYGEVLSGVDYAYIDVLTGEPIGATHILFSVGTFAHYDASREYAIEDATADLYTIDTSTAATTRIANTGLSGIVSGLRWDAGTDKTYATLHAPDCSGSTLYTIDLSSAATTTVGSVSGCIVALAIAPSGLMYGVDSSSGALVAIDKTNGSVESIGALGFSVDESIEIDVEPISGILYGFQDTVGGGGTSFFSIDVTTGFAMLITTIPVPAITALAFATRLDPIFDDGFDGN